MSKTAEIVMLVNYRGTVEPFPARLLNPDDTRVPVWNERGWAFDTGEIDAEGRRIFA